MRAFSLGIDFCGDFDLRNDDDGGDESFFFCCCVGGENFCIVGFAFLLALVERELRFTGRPREVDLALGLNGSILLYI